ncbi:hypothetical protein ABZ942_17370 [Nocardia sp. NPDC046473]|uniref:hypothetical protein n=1 Tax=Nocardia sp. NPDC046473 TaxID=3155733 RepID=UPI0033FF29A0
MDTAEINEALAHVYSLPHGRLRVERLEMLAAAAKSAPDRNLEGRVLLELAESYTYAGERDLAPVAYGRLLRIYDEFPAELGPLTHSVHWYLKWMTWGLIDNPAIPLPTVYRWFDELETRYRQRGYSLRPVLALRAQLARKLGQVEESVRLQDEAMAAPRDGMSDCDACERDEWGTGRAALGDDAGALAHWQPVIDGERTCAEEPHRVLARALLPLMRTGRFADARGAHLTGYPLVRHSDSLRPSVALHIEFCALTGNEGRGLEILSEHARWLTDPGADAGSRLAFITGVCVLLRRLVTLGLGYVQVAGETVDSLLAELDTEIAGLCARYDLRNENAAVSTHVATRLARQPLLERLPLGLRSRLPQANGIATGADRLPAVENAEGTSSAASTAADGAAPAAGSPANGDASAATLEFGGGASPAISTSSAEGVATNRGLPAGGTAAMSDGVVSAGGAATAGSAGVASTGGADTAGNDRPAGDTASTRGAIGTNTASGGGASLAGGGSAAIRAGSAPGTAPTGGPTSESGAFPSGGSPSASAGGAVRGSGPARVAGAPLTGRTAFVGGAVLTTGVGRTVTAFPEEWPEGVASEADRLAEVQRLAEVGAARLADAPEHAEARLREALAVGAGILPAEHLARLSSQLVIAIAGQPDRELDLADVAVRAAARWEGLSEPDLLHHTVIAARAFHRARRHGEAAALFEQVMAADGIPYPPAELATVRAQFGDSLNALRRYQDAARQFAQAAQLVEHDPDRRELHADLALSAATALDYCDQDAAAVAAYQRAAELFGDLGNVVSRARCVRSAAWLQLWGSDERPGRPWFSAMQNLIAELTDDRSRATAEELAQTRRELSEMLDAEDGYGLAGE